MVVKNLSANCKIAAKKCFPRPPRDKQALRNSSFSENINYLSHPITKRRNKVAILFGSILSLMKALLPILAKNFFCYLLNTSQPAIALIR